MLLSKSKEKSLHAAAVVAAIVPMTAILMLCSVLMLDIVV